MTRRLRKARVGILGVGWAWVLACGNACLAAPGQEDLRMPPEWAAFDIVWKTTWDETLMANSEPLWQEAVLRTKGVPLGLQQYIRADEKSLSRVIGLRRIRLLRAMIERFPENEGKHVAAYETMLRTSRDIMLPWWPDAENNPLGKLQELPGDNEISRRWVLLAGAAKIHGAEQVIDPGAIDELIGMCASTDAWLRISPSHYVPYSTALDRMLRGFSARQIAPLREAQDKSIRFLTNELHAKGGADEIVRLSRRAPWACSVHKLLMESGERALREGRRHWALASFDEVLAHASDPEIRLAAHVGRWLAYSQEPGDRDWLVRAMTAVPDDVKVPWQGNKVAAGKLKKLILSPQPPSSYGLASLLRNPIQLPASWPAKLQATDGPRLDFGLRSPWPVSQVQAARDAWLVFSPAIVARFNPDGSGPVWTYALKAAPWDGTAKQNYQKAVSRRIVLERRPVSPRDERSSAVSNDGLTLYFMETAGNQSVTALDVATGRQRWSTATRADWRGLMPMSRPVAADGRVFVLAVQAGADANPAKKARMAPQQPAIWRLVCMDGSDGGVMWESILGWQPNTLLDPARGAGGLTIGHGSIHISNNSGLVAKCDVRDGAVRWVRGYPCVANSEPLADAFGREGSPPLIAGDTLFVAPRDHSGVMAFHRETGEFIWETVAVPSDRLMGVGGGAVFGMDGRRLCALDQKTGRTLWSREFPNGTGAQGAVVGDHVIIASGGRVHRIAAANGNIVDSAQFGPLRQAKPVILESGWLVRVREP